MALLGEGVMMANLQGLPQRDLQGFRKNLQGLFGFKTFPFDVAVNQHGVKIAAFYVGASPAYAFLSAGGFFGGGFSKFQAGQLKSIALHCDDNQTYNVLLQDSGPSTQITVYDSSNNESYSITPTNANISTSGDCGIVDICDIGDTLYFSYYDNDTPSNRGLYSVPKTSSSAATEVYSDVYANCTSDGTNIYLLTSGALSKINTGGTLLATNNTDVPLLANHVHFFDSKIFVSASFTGSSSVAIFDQSLNYLSTFGVDGTGDGEFKLVKGISSYDGELYIADQNNNRIQVFDSSGNFIRKFSV